MAHFNTILSQLTALYPRHEFESLAKAHHKGQKFRSFSRWSQFIINSFDLQASVVADLYKERWKIELFF